MMGGGRIHLSWIGLILANLFNVHILLAQNRDTTIGSIDTDIVETSVDCDASYGSSYFNSSNYILLGQSFRVNQKGNLSRISFYPNFVGCWPNDTNPINLTMYLYKGYVWDIFDAENNLTARGQFNALSARDWFAWIQTIVEEDEDVQEIFNLTKTVPGQGSSRVNVISNENDFPYTCAYHYNATHMMDDDGDDEEDEMNNDEYFPEYTFSFVDDEVSQLTDIVLNTWDWYTYFIEFDRAKYVGPSKSQGNFHMTGPCVDENLNLTVYDEELSEDVYQFQSFYTSSPHGHKNDDLAGSNQLAWSTDIAVDKLKARCDFDRSDKFNYPKKHRLRVTMWYFDEALAIISQYVEASQYSMWQTIQSLTEDVVNTRWRGESGAADDAPKWPYRKYVRSDFENFLETWSNVRCYVDIEVWHMFGLCLRENGCGGWKKVENDDKTGFSDVKDDYNLTTNYQLETYISFLSGKVDHDNETFVGSLYKLVHAMIKENEDDFKLYMNAHMHDNGRTSFVGFGMKLFPLATSWFGIPEQATIGIYSMLGACIIFAIIGGIHGFVFWGADNIRISGVILFGLYTWDFYSDIVFTLSLVNYPRLAHLLWLSVAFIVVPWTANMISLSRYQNKWCKDETVRERVYQWFVSWQRVLYALAALSGSAFGTVELANSYVFGYDFFCMGLNERHLKKFNNNRLWSGILAENLPQLCIQLWFLFETDPTNPSDIVVLALTSSSLSIGAALLDIYSSKKLFAVLKDKQSGQYVDKSSLSMLVISREIHENKKRLQITTYAFRDMIAEILTTHPRSVEMHFPVATANGFKMKFTVFSKKLDSDAIKQILQQSIDNGDFPAKVKVIWRLNTKPDVKKLIIETDVMIGNEDEDDDGAGAAGDDDTGKKGPASGPGSGNPLDMIENDEFAGADTGASNADAEAGELDV